AKGKHMGTCYAVISNHENSAFTAQVADTRVQSILGETIQQWQKEYRKPLKPVEPPVSVPSTPATKSESWSKDDVPNGEDDQGPAVECRVKFRQRCDAAKSAVAQAEVSRYLRFVVADPREPVELKAAVEASLKDLRPPDDDQEQQLRIWMLDPALLTEQSAAFTRSHNVYARPPPLRKDVLSATVKVFSGLAEGKKDAFLTFDSGSLKAGVEIKKVLNKASLGEDSLSIWSLCPKQADLEKRANYARPSCIDHPKPLTKP
ncbi:unnamed protein product, partial [Symbiodinium microadriaticum]